MTYHPSALKTLSDLRVRFPDTRFLALGQTIWWDEPMKAVLRRMLDDLGLGGHLVLGVHDTDYFAKVALRRAGQARYELLPHNDGSTKDLWSAAGEISRLFGSETFPARHELVRHGAQLNRLAAGASDKVDFVDEVTEAWGWRGLVYTGHRDLIVHDLPLRDMEHALESLLSWGFDGTRESIVDGCCREEADRLSETLLHWVHNFRASDEPQSLTGLYQYIFPRLIELLLGEEPRDVGVCCTTHLLRLTPDTASLPRFRFVDLFLNEQTRALAVDAYNQAVSGSEIYALDRFGLGALPFDAIIPGYGRGTLRVTLRAIHIETRQPIRIPLNEPVGSIVELAAILNAEFGDEVTLVGKAVALISMLAQEFVFVFNEEGSGYVSRTRKMNDMLRARGVELDMRPILRLKYHAWDALTVTHATFALPDHLASAFGQRRITARDFGARWRDVVIEQSRLLDTIAKLRSPRQLMMFLARTLGGNWDEEIAAYSLAKQRLCDLRRLGKSIDAEVKGLYGRLAATKRELVVVERQRGGHYRSVAEWTDVLLAERSEFEGKIHRLLEDRRAFLAQISQLKRDRLALERGDEASVLRAQINHIELTAETERLRLVRDAILTRTGLPHTEHRPTAWHVPMIDPTGKWFDRIAVTTEVYTEPLVTP